MTRTSFGRRIISVLGLTAALLVVPFAAPVGLAHACGCGAYSPADGGTAQVPAETALIRSAGDGMQDTYVSLTLDSDVRSGALLFPVPDARTVVSAGPRDLFDRLADFTAPRSSSPTGDRGAPGSGTSVHVQKRQRIGPLDVVTLTAGDPAALTAWLTSNGFSAKPALTAAARPYIDQGWAFVAVRLHSGEAQAVALDGRLDPLHLRFHTRETVYPMRLSAMASAPERVIVYALGSTHLALQSATPGMAQVWSGHIRFDTDSELSNLTADGTTYLTRYDGYLRPEQITDDFRFRADASPPIDRLRSDATPASDSAWALGGSDHSARTAAILAIVIGILSLLGAAGVIRSQRGAPR